MHDVAFGSRKPEKLEDVQKFHSPRIPWNIHDPKVGRLENPPPFWTLGGQCLWSAYIPVKCTPGDELDTYQWLCHWWWHFICYPSQLSACQITCRTGEPLIAAGRAPDPKWSCLPLTVAFSFPWKGEDRLFGVWRYVSLTHACWGPRAGAGNIIPLL